MAPIDLPLRARIEGSLARAMGVLPPQVQLMLAGGRPVRIDGGELDPGIQLLLRARQLAGRRSFISGPGATPAQERRYNRRETAAVTGAPTSVGHVRDLEIDGARGRLPARHYTPNDPGGPHPLLVFAHGGGFVVGDLDTHDEPCRLLCRHAGVHVLALDYGLAPEHSFPAGLEDVLAGIRWAQAHAGELGADPARLAIGGDSAGGNLCAVAAQELAAAGGVLPVLQVLIYPPTDFAARTRSSELFRDRFLLTAIDRDWFDQNYFGDHDRADPRLSPLRAADLGGLPSAIVATAAFDPLRDEGRAYAAALRQAGTPVAELRAAGLIHGFINFTTINRSARDAVVALAGMIRVALAQTPPSVGHLDDRAIEAETR